MRICLTLRLKILLLVTGVVLGVAAVVVLVAGLLIGQEINRSVHKSVQATGRVLASSLRERSETLRTECLTFARQPVFKAYLGVTDSAVNPSGARPDAATIVDSLWEYIREMHVAGALITDRDGCSLGETWLTRQDRESRRGEPGVRAALEGKAWSGVRYYRGGLMLTVTVPVKIHSEVWGTFTAYSPIDTAMAGELRTALGSEVAFIRDRHVIGASRSLPGEISVSADEPQIVSYGNARYYALYAPLPGSRPSDRTGFVVLTPYSQAMELHHRFQFALLVVTLVALALAPLVGLSLSRGMTQPLEGVVQAARRLQSGEWPEPFHVERSDEIGLLQLVFNDMTAAIRASQARLLALIDADPLTELENHRRFQERLEQETKRSVASGDSLSLLLINIDRFHDFNKTHGHAAGDQALVSLASLLRRMLPDIAAPARYGPDEFAVLLPRHDIEEAEREAEAVRLAIERMETADGTGSLRVSIGCAAFGARTNHADGLLMAAELAAAQAKQLGRNRVCCFDSVAGDDETADPYQLYRFHKDGSLSTIQALAAAVDAKDAYTRGHSGRVADYAARLAAAIGLPADEVELIHTTGTLHDVGKIGIPDAILTKPSWLTPEERTIMETHPVLGEVIVRKAPKLSATLPGVRHHHERWDGKGYPDGLKQEEIPHMARILALADTFDAMTSDRPYRKGMALEIALAAVEEGAGTQFDPSLVPYFVRLFRQADNIKLAA